jgi:uncharacterized repeat protein (TIGR02543 family)
MSLVRKKMKKVFYVLFVLSISFLLVHALISNKSVKVDAASKLNSTYDVLTNFDSPKNNYVVDIQDTINVAGWIATSIPEAIIAYVYDSTIYDLSNFVFDTSTVDYGVDIISDVYLGNGSTPYYQMRNLDTHECHAVINGVPDENNLSYANSILGVSNEIFAQHDTTTQQVWGFDMNIFVGDTSIKIHDYKVVLVTSEADGFKVIEAEGFTIKCNQSDEYYKEEYTKETYTENKIVKVISDNFFDREIRGSDGDVNGGAFGNTCGATGWNMALGSFVAKDTYLIATGEYNDYYRVKYAGYNSLDNEGFILKIACQEITEGYSIATLIDNSPALNVDDTELFTAKKYERIVVTSIDDVKNTVQLPYAYSFKNEETNKLDWATKLLSISKDIISTDIYTVTASVDGTNGTASVSDASGRYGDTVTFTAIPDVHYVLDGWYNGIEKASTDLNYSVRLTSDLDLKARFTIETFNIKVTATEGGSAVASSNPADYNSNTTLTATANEGYTFSGWYNGDTLVSSDAIYTINNVTASINYTAKFTINTYTVGVTFEEGGTAVASAETANYNTNVTLTATPNEGYDFLGWYNGTTLISSDVEYTIINVKENIQLVGKFAIKTFSINITATEGGTATPSLNTADYGSSIILTATVNNDYLFLGWYEGDDLVSDNASYTINDIKSEINYRAIFVKSTYTVMITATEGGTANSSIDTVNYDANVELTATVNEGYTFSGWYNGDTLISNDAIYTINNVKADIDYTAEFVIQTRTVKVTAEEGGTANSSADTVNYDANVELTATVNEGYTFSGWYNGDTLLSDDATYTVNNVKANIDYIAKFAIKTFNIKTTTEDGGTATTSANTVNYGSNVTLIATADEGYTFSGWYNGDTLVSSDAEYTINNIKANMNYTAKYTKNTGCKSSSNSLIALYVIILVGCSLFLKKKTTVK